MILQRFQKSASDLYSADFYADRDARTRATAKTILSYVFGLRQINSICDVGCGVGTWLAVARELGAETVRGYEGPWARTAPLAVDADAIEFRDLEEAINSSSRFDLAVALEVAEHLSPGRGPGFVSDLCRLSDLVLFSAAIPGQGGTGHVNERWQSYWAGLFDGEGYDGFDAVRPLIWREDEIPWWYRQNMLLYARRGSEANLELADKAPPAPAYIDLVHPAMFAHAERSQPGRWVRRSLGRLLRRG